MVSSSQFSAQSQLGCGKSSSYWRASEMIQQSFIVCVLVLLSLEDTLASCKYKGKEICDGAVTNEYKTSVRICTEGKILRKKREEIDPGYPLAGGGHLISDFP